MRASLYKRTVHDERYMTSSLRFKEAAYARHFCLAFPSVRKLYAPFWTYDCVKYELCPRFKNGGACRPMADPYQISRGAVALGQMGGTSRSGGLGDASGSNATDDGTMRTTADGRGAVATSGAGSVGAQPVLLLGEGAAMEVVSKLFVESREFMLWREPRSWKSVSHMSDAMYAQTVEALLRCELSAQQLLILHSEAPDYDPQAETKGSGLLTGAPAVTPAEKQHVEWLQTLYSERRRWREGDHRFCAPGIATAALVSRFASGLPANLLRLPIRVVALVRHPSDVVIERLQARPIKGLSPYPECTIATIRDCAAALCGAMTRMLDDLGHAREAGRLKLLKWESLTRRRQKASTDLHAWLGMSPELNSTGGGSLVMKLAENIEAQQKAFNALAKAFPISLQSLRVVEGVCAPVMQRLGFRATADIAPDANSGSTSRRRHAKRFENKKKKRKKDSQGDGAPVAPQVGAEGASMEPGLLLLRRRVSASDDRGGSGRVEPSSSSRLMWCPVRLTGTEALARLFVTLDAPKASRAPPCFPGSRSDVCPVPRSAAWMPARWGAYPFEVVDAQLGARQLSPNSSTTAASSAKLSYILGGFSFAFVRNPWERLASAYAKLIAIEDVRTSTHRTWIREMHGLAEREPIGFSHFVRWVVAQEPLSMHRAWRPYTRMCHFNRVRYSFIGRFERLQQDVERLMEILGMRSERERRAWQKANAETRPLVPRSSPDSLLKLHHLYYSDDERDLVALISEKYREDIELFGYTFPGNISLAPWESGSDR